VSIWLYAHGTDSQSPSTTDHYALDGGHGISAEANAEAVVRGAYTSSKLWVNVTSNDVGASTFRTRKNGANGAQSVSIGASTTGTFADDSNTDSLVTGDRINYQLVTGAGGTFLNFNAASLLAASSDIPVCAYAAFVIVNFGATNYFALMNTESNVTVEQNAEVTARTAVTVSNMRVQIIANSISADCTFRTRKNRANGSQTVTIISKTTGAFEDVTNTDSLVAGDEFNYQLVAAGTMNSLTVGGIGCKWASTTRRAGVRRSTTVNSNLNRYAPPGGRETSWETTETNVSVPARTTLDVGKLYAYLSANTVNASSTIAVRKNAVTTALAVSVGASTTGVFEDTSNTVSFTATDLAAFIVATGGSSGSLLPQVISVEQVQPAAGFTGTIAATLQKATASLTGVMVPSGAIASTLQPATAALAGTQTQTGAIASSLQAATAALAGEQVPPATGAISATLAMALASLAGTQIQTGAIASSLPPATAALAGAHAQSGAIASALAMATAALTGTQQPSGAIASSLQPATASLAGTQTQTGTIASALTAATAALSGVMEPSGTIASTLAMATAALAGTHEQTGAIASTLQPATASLTGTHTEGEVSGAVASALQPATASLAGTQEQTGTIASTLTAATAALAGVMEPSGAIAATLTKATASLTGTAQETVTGSAAATLQAATASLTGAQPFTGTIAASLQMATAALSGTQEQTGAIASSLQPATASLTAEQVLIGTIAATLQAATGSLTGTQTQTGQIAATLQILSVALLGTHEITGTIAAILQYATAAANDIQPSPRIVNLDGSYVPITDMVASVLMAVIDGSYVPITQLEGAVS
jgi:hypothetical protein